MSNDIPLLAHDLDKPSSNYIKFTCNYTFIPVVSIMGGLVSNEVIKLVSNKYTPISQWFEWSDFDIIKNYESQETVDNEIKQIYEKLNDSNILLVGCGALGCECMKHIAMMCAKSLTIIDPDHIERSNLSRQFLFQSNNIGNSKCLTAIDSIKCINSKLNMTGYIKKLHSLDTTFTNKVFKDQDIVINALDNIEARRYVDSVCFERNLPLFESGTMGMKCNTQPVIPFLTETYSNSSDNDTQKEYPVCTIKNFPNSIHHTIHWARDYFELFNRGPINCNKYIMINNYLDNLSSVDKGIAIEDINFFLSEIPNSWEYCAKKAINLFEKEYIYNINKLLDKHPKDYMINGELFWSHGKLCPSPLYYNIINEFVQATTHILCQIYNINNDFTLDDVNKFLAAYKFNEELNFPDTDIIKTDKQLTNLYLYPIEFEKDNDNNWHVEWITCASNNRALNYGIPTISKYETKGIAGKIIPAVATTTSTVVGLISIELLKYLNNVDVTKYRSWYLNMADNTAVYSEPLSMPEITINNKTFNGWTKFKYTKDISLSKFIKYYNNIFNINIDMILYNSTIIFADFLVINNDTLLSKLFKDQFEIDLYQNETSVIIMADEEIQLNINISVFDN
jgi:ubiquitin-activating enzyme E1